MDDRKRDALEALVEALIDGTIEAASMIELDALLRDDPEAQRFYLQRIDLHHSLRWHVAGTVTHRALAALRPTSPSWTRAAAVAAIAAGLLLVFFVRAPERPPAGPPVATLTDTEAPVWEGSRPDTALPAGRLRLRSGAARLGWHGGTETLLRGPADLELSGPSRGRIHAGVVTVGVPHGTSDFELSAPGLDVTSRGAEYGLRTDGRGGLLLHVFDGEVLARVHAPSSGLPQTARLTRDESLRRDPDGTLTAHILGDAPAFARLRRVADPDVLVVSNPSFEYPKAGSDGRLAAAGWMLQAHPLANAENMDVDMGAGVVGKPAPRGEQWGYLNARTFPDGRRFHTSMHQAVGRLLAGAPYVLNVSVAGSEPLYTIGLYAGSPESGPVTPLREWNPPAAGDVELRWRCPADHPSAGQTLFLRFASVAGARPGTRQVLFDDVRLRISE